MIQRMKHLKLFFALFVTCMMGANAWATDLNIDEYMSTFNGQYSYNVLMTTPESDWHWTTATTPNSDSSEYPSWGGSSYLYPYAVTSKESVEEGSVRITLDCSFKRYSSSYYKCRVEVFVGDKLLYCQYAKDNRYYYNYADIETTDYNTVDQMLTFVSFGKVSGEVSVRVNRYSVNGAYTGTFSLRSIKVERTNLVPPTVVSDQPNPAEVDYTLTVTNDDPDADLYWTSNQSNPYNDGYTPNAIESGFQQTYDDDYSHSFYAYTNREGFYSEFVGGTYQKKVVRNIQYSREGGYFLSNTLPSSVAITCNNLKEGDKLFYQKLFKDTEWKEITSGTTIYINNDDIYSDYNNPSAVRLSAKVVNASGMESEEKRLYLSVVSVPDVSFNGFCNSNNKYEWEFDGPQEMTLGFSSYPVEGLRLQYSYDGENNNWQNYNPNNKPVISSTKRVWGRFVYDSSGDVVKNANFNYIINPAHVTGSCLYNYYTDMPFDVTIGCSSFVNTYVAYTTDDSDPRTSSTAVEVRGEEQTAHIAESCTLKMAVNQSGSWGNVVERTMSIQLNQPMFSFKQNQFVPDYNDSRSLGADSWLRNKTPLSCKQYPYYNVYYDNGNVGSWSMSSTNYGFFEVKDGLGECTFDVMGDVDTDGDNSSDTRYETHMVVTSLDQWNVHDSIDFNRTDQTLFTTYEANGCTWQTDANGKRFLLIPQGATITVAAPEGINLVGVFLNGGNNEANINHLRQDVEGCYVSQVPVSDWYCKWIGRSQSVTFVADAESRVYGIESFYYLTPSEIWINYYNNEVVVGRTIKPDYVDNPYNLPISYSSSDTSIATVDAETGVVTGVAVGICTITAEFAGDGEYAPFKQYYEIQVIPDVSTVKFMGQELKSVTETMTGEIGNGTWTFSWEEEEEQEFSGGGEAWAPRARYAPRRNVGSGNIIQVPVLTLNNVNLQYNGEGPVIEVNDYSEFRIRLIGENSITMTNNCPPIAIGTLNGQPSRGASVLITNEEGVWETNQGGGGYEPLSAPIRRVKRKTNGTGSVAKLTLAGGPMGIYVCNGNLFIADCEVDASGTDYGVFFTDYEEESGGEEFNAPQVKEPKKVLPTYNWSSQFEINENTKLKLQGDQAAIYGQLSNRNWQFNYDAVELKDCDIEDGYFEYYWDNNDKQIYSYMQYDSDQETYIFAKLLEFANDYFTAKTVEGVKMKFKVLDEDTKTCQVYGTYDMDNYYGNPAIEQYYSGSVTIPSKAMGYQVVGISDYAFTACSLSSITIPASVTSIGEVAFINCNNLASVTLLDPPTEDSIALPIQENGDNSYHVFDDIKENAVLYVPANAVEAYEDSDWAEFFTIKPFGAEGFVFSVDTPQDDENMVRMTFMVTRAEENNYTVQTYGYWADGYAETAIPRNYQGSLTIPEKVIYDGVEYTVTAIGEESFDADNSPSLQLTKITIPSTVTQIGDYAFCYCYPNAVYTYAENPPTLAEWNPFSSDSGTLYVPIGHVEDYEESDWAQYFNNIVEMGSGEVVQGDASGDGIIDAVDFNMIANEILGYHQDNFNRAAADINGDNEVDAIDFNMIANKILYGNFDGVQGNKMNKKKTEITESEDSKEPM